MRTINYNETGPGRNNSPHHPVLHDYDLDRLTRGGRVVYRRARLSTSVCNLIASIAGIGGSVTER